MLVLNRRMNDQVILRTAEGEVRVTVVFVRGREVRLGFEAPDSINIVRAEIDQANLQNGVDWDAKEGREG